MSPHSHTLFPDSEPTSLCSFSMYKCNAAYFAKMEMNNDHQNMTVDEVWDIFKKKVLDAVDQTVPSKMINNNKKRLPWITKEIKALIRKRNKLYQKKKRNKNYKEIP